MNERVTMRRIALEEAVVIPGRDLILEHKTHPEFSQHIAQLKDIHQQRINKMDEAKIDMAILSVTTPGLQSLAMTSQLEKSAQEWNDYLAEMVIQNPTRFRAFACLPTFAPELAINELRRLQGIKEFVGCMINGYDSSGFTPAKYFDDICYDDLWAYINENDIPIYLHPRGIPDSNRPSYEPYHALYGSAWGFHIETAEHVLRLMLSGVFDRHPKLKIIIGHMGEMLPFWAWRLDHRMQEEGWFDKMACEKKITDYLKTNIYITTSGYFDTPALNHAIATVGIERIMFAVDYPYEDNLKASQWLDGLSLSDDDKEKISALNAENLLKI